jgi:cytochrome P450
MIPSERNRNVLNSQKVIRQICRDLITEKEQKLAGKEAPDLDILSVALESGGFTKDNMVDQLMTFLAAGHETTATALEWAIFMMCVNPGIQSRLREEARKHIPSRNSEGTISSLDIDHTPYFAAVCSETLRYWSPVALTYRETVANTTIQGKFVPKGTLVMMSAWATNKSVRPLGP